MSRPRSGIPSTQQSYLRAMVNPFHTSKGAKIPDGAVPESHALTHRICKEISAKVTTPGEDEQPPVVSYPTIHIIMLPGLHTGMIVGAPGEDDGIEWFRWNSDSYITGSATGNAATDLSPDNKLKLDGDVNKWRIVSQGLRLSLLNTYEQNDGWWESVRMNYKPTLSEWEVYAPSAAITAAGPSTIVGTTAYFRPNETFFQNFIDRNLAEHKSYNSGSLKDIHTRQWNIAPYSNNNDFIDVRSNYQIPTQGVTVVGNSGNNPMSVVLTNGYNQAASLFSACHDEDHDMVYIRIHQGNSGTKLLADAVCHHEVCYDLDTPLAKFMTQNSKVNANLLDRVKNLKQQLNANSAGVQP